MSNFQIVDDMTTQKIVQTPNPMQSKNKNLIFDSGLRYFIL